MSHALIDLVQDLLEGVDLTANEETNDEQLGRTASASKHVQQSLEIFRLNDVSHQNFPHVVEFVADSARHIGNM